MGSALTPETGQGRPAGEAFLERDGVRLRVRTAGAGLAVLLIHGWALDLDMWSPQFEALAPGHRLIAFDRRGFGLSRGQPSIERDVDDVRWLLDRLEVPRAALVGMSQGARVALQCALSFPERLACLVLDGVPGRDAMAGGDEPDEIPLDGYRELVRGGGLDAMRRAWREHPLARLVTRDPAARALLDGMIARYAGTDLLAAPRPYPPLDLRMTSLRLPALVVNGERDSQRRRAAGRELAALLPDALYASVPAAAHLPNLDNPAFYNDLVAGFVARHA